MTNLGFDVRLNAVAVGGERAGAELSGVFSEPSVEPLPHREPLVHGLEAMAFVLAGLVELLEDLAFGAPVDGLPASTATMVASELHGADPQTVALATVDSAFAPASTTRHHLPRLLRVCSHVVAKPHGHLQFDVDESGSKQGDSGQRLTRCCYSAGWGFKSLMAYKTPGQRRVQPLTWFVSGPMPCLCHAFQRSGASGLRAASSACAAASPTAR